MCTSLLRVHARHLQLHRISSLLAAKCLIYKNMSDQVRSAALACVLGAFIGDALGAYIEFRRTITPELLQETLLMKGSGSHGLGVGQVTDDSEMAICLASGLINGEGMLNMDLISQYYAAWYMSDPFGIGNTCSTAFRVFYNQPTVTASMCIEQARQRNQTSQSNGSLMRLTPLCVWAHRLPPAQAAHAARIEASMTHSHETIHHAGACYVLAAGHLINHFGDREGAYQAAKTYAFSDGNTDIQEWFTHIETEPPLVEPNKIGWAKIGFTYAFRALRENLDYMTAVQGVLVMGGDTDTNAAIVGGLVGAAVGYLGLPMDYLQKVMEYTFQEKGGIERPDFLRQGRIINYIDQLVVVAPTEGKVTIDGVVTEL